MTSISFETLFSAQVMNKIFPADRADRFFEALFGDASEGAYDIALAFVEATENQLGFEFKLKKRRGKCLVCSLTHGLPHVFMRHPVIDIGGVVREIDSRMSNGKRCGTWSLGCTREISTAMHVMPLMVDLVADEPM